MKRKNWYQVGAAIFAGIGVLNFIAYIAGGKWFNLVAAIVDIIFVVVYLCIAGEE